MWKSLIAVTVVAALCQAEETSASVVVSNLSETQAPVPYAVDDFDFFGSRVGTDTGQSFTTGSDSALLNSCTLLMASNLSGGSFSVQLWSDAAGNPGALLASLTGDADPAAAGLYTYTAGAPIALDASTAYWIVARVDHIATDKFYSWEGATSGNESGAPGWSLGDKSAYLSYVDGALIQQGPNLTPTMISIDASVAAVPESAWLGLLAAALMATAQMWRQRLQTRRESRPPNGGKVQSQRLN